MVENAVERALQADHLALHDLLATSEYDVEGAIEMQFNTIYWLSRRETRLNREDQYKR